MAELKTYNGVKKIVVVNAGWVFIGQVKEEEAFLYITEAQNIRQWGTKSGLGQIALSGMPKEAQCDNYGLVKVPMSQVLFTIDCKV